MASIQASQLGDLLKTTLRELGRGRFTAIMSDLQEHWAMKNLLRKSNVDIQSGTAIQFDVVVSHSDSARNVGQGEVDVVNMNDGTIQGYIDWRQTTCNFAIIANEIDMNRDPARIVDLYKVRRVRALTAAAEIFESNFWDFPAATDTKTPFGLPYWATKSSSTTGGFLGGIPSGYSAVANISPTTYSRWNNWACQYATVSEDDFVRKAREAATKTDFKPPVEGITDFDTGGGYGFFANYTVVGRLEELTKAQNENLGNDVASQDGKTMFRRAPVNYVPKLDSDTTDPFYGINWGVMKTAFLRGWNARETHIPVKHDQHTVAVTHMDWQYNFICYDRRRLMVLATGTTYPS